MPEGLRAQPYGVRSRPDKPKALRWVYSGRLGGPFMRQQEGQHVLVDSAAPMLVMERTPHPHYRPRHDLYQPVLQTHGY